MSKWKIVCGAALLALSVGPSASADEFTKLTLLTFSAPVEVPGITLPAGTYRFQLADPTTGRSVVKVSDKDGTKTYGMFISMSNERLTPTDRPVVMFKETAVGAPPAVQVWFYPGETYGYEFAYPHDQALRIAKANHQPVLAYANHTTASSTDEERMTSMKSTEVTRIDENDRPISADQALKESSAARPATTTAAKPATTTAAKPATTTAAKPATTTATTPAATATAGKPATTTATTGTTASSGRNAPAATSGTPAATSGSTAAAPTSARRHLPRTGSSLPLLALLSGLSLAGGLGLRVQRELSDRAN